MSVNTDSVQQPQQQQSADNNEAISAQLQEGIAPKQVEDHRCQLFFAKCDIECTEDEIKNYFSTFGEVTKMKLIRDNNSKKFKGFGFVTFPTSDCIDVIQKNRPHTIRNRQIDTRRVFGSEHSQKPEISARVDKIYFGGIKDKDLNKQLLLDYFTPIYGTPNNLSYTAPRIDAKQNQKNGFAFITYEDTDTCDKIILDNPHIINGIQYTLRKGLKKEEMPHLMNATMAANQYPHMMYGGPAPGTDFAQHFHPHHNMAIPYSSPQGRPASNIPGMTNSGANLDQNPYNQMMMNHLQNVPNSSAAAYPFQQAQQQYLQSMSKFGQMPTAAYYQTPATSAAAAGQQYYQVFANAAAANQQKPSQSYGMSTNAMNSLRTSQQQQQQIPVAASMYGQSMNGPNKHSVSTTLGAVNPSASTSNQAGQIKNLKVNQVLPQTAPAMNNFMPSNL